MIDYERTFVINWDKHPVSGGAVGVEKCPHCLSEHLQPHGHFTRRDGSREPRYRCTACRRTFNQHTGTGLAYLKKRDAWLRMVERMKDSHSLSVRRMAEYLDVTVATAFAWRHRFLGRLRLPPQPVLEGAVTVEEAYVRYSEKGSWYTFGPGARKLLRPGDTEPPRRFRRFADGKPTYIIMACSADHQVAVSAGKGWPCIETLEAILGRLLADGAELWAFGMAHYDEACELLGVPHHLPWSVKRADRPSSSRAAALYQSNFRGWLAWFHGIATSRLRNYLHWYRYIAGDATTERRAVAAA